MFYCLARALLSSEFDGTPVKMAFTSCVSGCSKLDEAGFVT